jgi:large subunit ribosomal protein L21
VTIDQAIRVERLRAEPGDEVILRQVLLVSDGQDLRVGHPLVSGAQVRAEVLGHDRAKKIIVFKKKRRKGYHKTQGHRQHYTALRIKAIYVGDAAGTATAQGDDNSGDSNGS